MPANSADLILTAKLINASISAAGFVGGVVVLYFLRPSMAVRTVLVSAAALTLVAAILLAGDLFATEVVSTKYPFLKEAGWFSLGLLFGSGRGDLIVIYLDKRKEKSAVDSAKTKSEATADSATSDSVDLD